MSTAELVIELGKQIHRDAETYDVRHADTYALRGLGRLARRVDQPAQRGIVPSAGVDPRPRASSVGSARSACQATELTKPQRDLFTALAIDPPKRIQELAATR